MKMTYLAVLADKFDNCHTSCNCALVKMAFWDTATLAERSASPG
jgi:hypothetical protein